MFKAKNKNKMRKVNQLYKTEIREVDKEKRGSKFTTKVLANIQMSGVTMVLYFTFRTSNSL